MSQHSFTASMSLLKATTISEWREDAGVLLNGVTCTILCTSVQNALREILTLTQIQHKNVSQSAQ